MLGKILTAKVAAIAGVLVLTGGVASAATGALPGPVQDTASHAAEHVGLHIPKSDDNQGTDSTDATDDNGDTANTPTTVEHPDNHGNDVSTVAHDHSTTGQDHGTAVCTVASDGKCKAGADDNTEGKSADHRKDGDHPTTSTTVTDDNSGSDSHTSGDDSGSNDSGQPADNGTHGGGSDSSHHGSND